MEILLVIGVAALIIWIYRGSRKNPVRLTRDAIKRGDMEAARYYVKFMSDADLRRLKRILLDSHHSMIDFEMRSLVESEMLTRNIW